MEFLRKRMKTTEGSEEGTAARVEAGVEEEMISTAGSDEIIQVCSDEMESDILILEKMDRFTQLLETGKQLFKNLSSEFEEHLILIHREQMEKWQDDIKLLRIMDSTKKASKALLQNAQLHYLQNDRRKREGNCRRRQAGVEEEMMSTAGLAEIIQVCSKKMESDIQRILEKIDRFTKLMLEIGKQLFKDLSLEFEERLILIHREQMEKLQDDIKLLRIMDSTNEASRALLQNAQPHYLQNDREN